MDRGERSHANVGKGYCANLGHQEDETGLVYMRARYYEPTTGRFVSEDPARDGGNWYLYADGNPITYVDFTGKFFSLILGFGLSAQARTQYDRNVVVAGLGTLPGLLSTIAAWFLMIELGLDGIFLARKSDIKQIDYISKKYGLSRDQRRELHDEITGQNLSLEEIEDIAKDIAVKDKEAKDDKEK